MDFLLLCPAAIVGFAAAVWGIQMLWLAVKSILKKEKFTLRKTIIWASSIPEAAAPPKTRFLIALAVPVYWAAVFYFAKEGLYEYIDRLLSYQMLDSDTLFSDIVFLYTIAFTFYQYAGFLAYDGVPDKERED